MKTVVNVLKRKGLERRYARLANTRMAKLTAEAIQRGYSIAFIKKENLRHSKDLFIDAKVALEHIVRKTSGIDLWCFTDLSELGDDKIYVAFKEMEGQFWNPRYIRISD